jgi:hypothetical protein
VSFEALPIGLAQIEPRLAAGGTIINLFNKERIVVTPV